MIYVGYQGIGKSTLCHKRDKCIDLESGNFFADGYRHEDWYKVYANIAKHLSNQGKIVFTSSHKVLREYMNKMGIRFTVVFPSLELKEQWIAKLKQRADETHKLKDFKAWLNARERYRENIHDLSKERHKVIITTMDYSLEDVIEKGDEQ